MSILNWINSFGRSVEKELDSLTKEKEKNTKKEVPKQIDKKEILKRKWLNNTREVFNRIEKEIKIFPFKDKVVKSINSDGRPQLDYRFENGDLVKLIFKDNTSFEIKFRLRNENTHYKIKSAKLYANLNYISSLADDCIDRIQTKESITNHPLKDKYNLIVRKIKLRVEEINKMPLNNPKREALINELNTYKKIAGKLKEQIMNQTA